MFVCKKLNIKEPVPWSRQVRATEKKRKARISLSLFVRSSENIPKEVYQVPGHLSISLE